MLKGLTFRTVSLAAVVCLGLSCTDQPQKSDSAQRGSDPVPIAPDDPVAIKEAASKPETPVAVQTAYALRAFVGDYLERGVRSPLWDANVTNGLSALIRARTSGKESERANAWTNISEAVRLGCGDPLVAYSLVHLNYGNGSRADTAQAKEWVSAAEGMLKSSYNHVRKGWAAYRAAEALHASSTQTNLTAEVVQWRNETYNQCVAMLNEEPATPPEEVCSLITTYLSNLGRKGYVNSFELLWPLLYEKYPHASGIWLIRGKFYVDYAWHARGGGYADTVSKDDWKLFAERLALAEEALEKSWALRPAERTAIECLRLELGQGKGRPRMERFFQRAMLLNTNSFEACNQKLYYLFPRWYGSPKEMLDFAWECIRSKEWGGNVPLIMLDVQDELARLEYPGEEQVQERKKYWTREGVWPAIDAAFGRFFELNPKSTGWLHNHFWYAYHCQRWDAANDLLNRLGKINYSYFGGREKFEQMAAETRSHSGRSGI